MIEGDHNALDQIVEVDKISFHGLAIGIEHQRHCVRLPIFARAFGTDEVAPPGAAEDVVAERERVFEIVLFHDPRRPQTTSRKVVLNVVLLEHYFFQNF